MAKRIIAFVLIAYVPVMLVMFSGCEEQQSYTARITGVENILHHSSGGSSVTYDKPIAKAKAKARPVYKKTTPKKPKYSSASWTPNRNIEKNWDAIVIHHSATQKGSMSSIDRYHRNNNGWAGVGYNFVIGNGSGSPAGKVETTFRWRQQRTGAHCKTDYTNWANRNAIGICLVGNFETARPNYKQMNSLVDLVQFLSRRYNISVNRIYGHNDTPKHSTTTACPGRKFPMTYLKASI